MTTYYVNSEENEAAASLPRTLRNSGRKNVKILTKLSTKPLKYRVRGSYRNS